MVGIYSTVGGKLFRPHGSNHRRGSPWPKLKTAVESFQGTVASGWDAFDDDDLSFLDSMEPGSMAEPSDEHPMHQFKAGPGRPTSAKPETINNGISHSSETWTTLTRPGHREKTRPTSRPVPKAFFSDTDPLIEVSVHQSWEFEFLVT